MIILFNSVGEGAIEAAQSATRGLRYLTVSVVCRVDFSRARTKKFLRSSSTVGPSALNKAHQLRDLLSAFEGMSFREGLYRFVSLPDIDAWRIRLSYAFPQFDGRVTCFGYDWLGRAFAIDSQRSEQDKSAILMFNVGAGEALEIPCNVETFHDRELVEFR